MVTSDVHLVRGANRLVCRRSPPVANDGGQNLQAAKKQVEVACLDALHTDLPARSFDLITQIEDELLLALPISPRHPVCPDEVLPESVDAEKKPSPFAVLANLKTKH